MMGGKFLKMTMSSVPLRAKTVLVRTDYNVPLTDDGKVRDDYRIVKSLPTIRKLLSEGCKVVIISHLGRPNGVANPSCSLEPVAVRLAELLGEPVRFVDRCVGDKARMAIKRSPGRSVVMLENLRFHPEEEMNDTEFARQLAKDSGASLFIQDGFGVVHRAHASTDAITRFLPSVAGFLVEREFRMISEIVREPTRPLVAVLGGAKVSDKIEAMEALVDVADAIIVGGAVANTFLAIRGVSMGESRVDMKQKGVIDAIYKKVAQKVGDERVDSFVVLPVDLGVGTSTSQIATRQDVSIHDVPEGSMALDLGPETARLIESIVSRSRTVVWSGTLGYSEVPAFRTTSVALARTLKQCSDVFSLIGGGETADFAVNWDDRCGDSFGYVSTGGDASLALISGKKLPGIEALLDA
jgi:phosphoglycerate kinase